MDNHSGSGQDYGELLKIANSPDGKKLLNMVQQQGGAGLSKQLDKAKKPYIYVGLVCGREQYQGQGFMRKLMETAFAEGNRLGVPVILDTDAKSKCDKYMHLGMELAGTRRFGEHGVLYDLIRSPAGQKG